MGSMIDATCPKCKKRFGWAGKMTDMPACPRCGYRPPQQELIDDEKAMEEMQQLLMSRSSSANCRKQRFAAGLTLTQAAVQLGIAPKELKEYEEGKEIPEHLVKKMEELYGICVDPPEESSNQ